MKICLIGNKANQTLEIFEVVTSLQENSLIKTEGHLNDMDCLRKFKSMLRQKDKEFVITSCDDDSSIPYLRDMGFSFIEVCTNEQFPKYDCKSIEYCDLEHTMVQKLKTAIEEINNPTIDCLILGCNQKKPVSLTELSKKLLRLQTNGVSRFRFYQRDLELIQKIRKSLQLSDVEINEISYSESDEKMKTGRLICADNNLESYWDFDLREKMLFNTYIMLKPDALIMSKFEKILEEIYKFGFSIEGFIPFNSFVENAMKLYYLKPEPYDLLVRRHLEMSAEIFDNKGMVLILSKKTNYVKQMKETLFLKNRIRKLSFTFGHNGGIGEYGKEATFQLNMAHCPDPELCNYRKDLGIVSSFGTMYDFKKDEIKKYLI